MGSNVRGVWVRARGWTAACFVAVAAISSLGVTPVAHTAEPIRLYIFAGQSNMTGYSAETSQLPEVDPKLEAPTANVRFYGPADDYAAKWTTLQAPTEVKDAAHHSGFGPELSAAPLLAARHSGTTVAVVKLSKNGSNLFSEWNPGNPIGIYPRLIARVVGAQRELAAQTNTPVRIAGFFWMQGESDGVFQQWAKHYDENLTHFIASLRSDLHAPDMPFVMGRIADVPHGPRFTNVVRAAQEHVARTVRRTYIVSTDDLSHAPDSPIHYDTRGTVYLGRRFVGRFPL